MLALSSNYFVQGLVRSVYPSSTSRVVHRTGLGSVLTPAGALLWDFAIRERLFNMRIALCVSCGGREVMAGFVCCLLPPVTHCRKEFEDTASRWKESE